MMSKYEQLYEGEWIRPVSRGFREQCCDCGLVHDIDFRIVDGKHVEFKIRKVNKRATAAVRRGFRFEKD